MRYSVLPVLFALLLAATPASAAKFKMICKGFPEASCANGLETAFTTDTCTAASSEAAVSEPSCTSLCGTNDVCGASLVDDAPPPPPPPPPPPAGPPEESGGANDAGSGDTGSGPKEYKLVNPLGTSSIPQLIGQILSIFLSVVGTAAFLMFVYGGFLWLISGGSADRIKQGKNTMVWAALGLVLVFSSAALVRFVLQAFGAGT